MKLSHVHKITISALLLALTIILTRITPFQNFPLIPWVRISLGPSLIIFSSILCGPFYGAIVGAGSDILGIVLFPNSLGFGINPLFTIIYGLLGILPWVLYIAFNKIKNPRISYISLVIAMILIFIGLIWMMFFSKIISSNYELKLTLKFIIVGIAFLLLLLTAFLIYFINKKFKNRFSQNSSLYVIGIVCLISEILIMTILNSFVKSLTFEVNYLIIFFAQLIVFFIDVPLNSFVVSLLLKLVSKFNVSKF